MQIHRKRLMTFCQ